MEAPDPNLRKTTSGLSTQEHIPYDIMIVSIFLSILPIYPQYIAHPTVLWPTPPPAMVGGLVQPDHPACNFNLAEGSRLWQYAAGRIFCSKRCFAGFWRVLEVPGGPGAPWRPLEYIWIYTLNTPHEYWYVGSLIKAIREIIKYPRGLPRI